MNPKPLHELVGAPIPWDRVTPDEYTMISAIAERADLIYRDWIRQRRLTLRPGQTLLEPDPMLIAMDVSVAHISRGLDLRAMLGADDLSFIADIVSIQTNVQRLDGTLPFFVHLRFALKNREIVS